MAVFRAMQPVLADVGKHLAHEFKNPLNAVYVLAGATQDVDSRPDCIKLKPTSVNLLMFPSLNFTYDAGLPSQHLLLQRCACTYSVLRKQTGMRCFADTQATNSKDTADVAQHQATLGCVLQLTAMVNLLRENLTYMCSAEADAPGEGASANVSSVLEQTLSDLQPLSRTSRVQFTTAIEKGLIAAVDGSRCVSAHAQSSPPPSIAAAGAARRSRTFFSRKFDAASSTNTDLADLSMPSLDASC